MKKEGIKLIAPLSIMLLITVGLSGCTDSQSLPSDEKCLSAITDYLLEHSDFYSISDTMYLDDWERVTDKLFITSYQRRFNWMHSASNGTIGSYAGLGYINDKLVVSYTGQ